MIAAAHVDYVGTKIISFNWRVICLIAATIICVWLVCVLIRRR
jgi:hypothetical protein